MTFYKKNCTIDLTQNRANVCKSSCENFLMCRHTLWREEMRFYYFQVTVNNPIVSLFNI